MAKEAAAKKPAKKWGARSRLRARRRARKNPSGGGGGSSPRANPPILTDFTHVLLPGFAAYAGTRFLQRIAYTLAAKRWPRFAKHVHALSGVAAAGSAWLLAHRVKSIAPYHDGIVLGSGIAALQGVVQTYIPRLGWVASDITGANAPASLPKGTNGSTSIEPSAADGDEFSYLEEELAPPPGARTVAPPRRGSNASTLRMAAQATGDGGDGIDDDIMEELGANETLDDLGGGIFDGGSLSN